MLLRYHEIEQLNMIYAPAAKQGDNQSRIVVVGMSDQWEFGPNDPPTSTYIKGHKGQARSRHCTEKNSTTIASG